MLNSFGSRRKKTAGCDSSTCYAVYRQRVQLTSILATRFLLVFLSFGLLAKIETWTNRIEYKLPPPAST